MDKDALIQVRIDSETKQQADQLFKELGLDTPTAVRLFLKQSLKVHNLPFQIGAPNQETLQAMEDAKNGRGLTGPFDNPRDMMASLMEDDDRDGQASV